MLKEEKIINIMKQFITVHILHFDKLEPSDYMGEEMLHVQGDSFVDGEKGFSILSRYTKTCRENADKLSLLNHRCLHIYVLHKPSSIQVPRNTFQEAKWFLQTTACLHFH